MNNSYQQFSNGSGSAQNSFGKQAPKYQPVGFVTSMYDQSQGRQNFGAAQTTGYQQQTAQTFHTSSYRGNQQGHDTYLRSDSKSPTQSFGSQPSAAGTNWSSGQSAQTFHTANYRGSQAGHDNYLRSDSQWPSQTQSQSQSQNQSQFIGSGITSSYKTGISAQAGQTYQNQNAQSFHTANYRGNQTGHDQYLRSDSGAPSSYGVTSFSSMK